jgi:hypothetical protein
MEHLIWLSARANLKNTPEWWTVTQFLESLCDSRLLYKESGLYLSLAVPRDPQVAQDTNDFLSVGWSKELVTIQPRDGALVA